MPPPPPNITPDSDSLQCKIGGKHLQTQIQSAAGERVIDLLSPGCDHHCDHHCEQLQRTIASCQNWLDAVLAAARSREAPSVSDEYLRHQIPWKSILLS